MANTVGALIFIVLLIVFALYAISNKAEWATHTAGTFGFLFAGDIIFYIFMLMIFIGLVLFFNKALSG
jgi:hypothetical protein